jgi:hypothetical protein
MGRDPAYWYRRDPRVLVGEGRVSFRDVNRQHARVSDRKACVSRALAMPLTSDRCTQPYYSARLISVGQFRTADGLVLLGIEIPPERRNRITVQKMGKDKD